MLLAVDIGNTTIELGIFKGGELYANWRFKTEVEKTVDEYAAILFILLKHAKIKPPEIKEAIISSVVPPLYSAFNQLFKRYFNFSPLMVESGIRTGINIRGTNSREIGSDRIVNVVAAHYLYNEFSIVIDLGTATTFDIVSEKGDYLGGVIAPGIQIAAEALFHRTAKLPRVDLTCPEGVIGHNTVSAMQSGLIFGYIGLIEGITSRIQRELDNRKAKVIATGGYAELLANKTNIIDIVSPHLNLEGLRIIHGLNRGWSHV